MEGIKNLLLFINNNWALITTCFGLIILIKAKYEKWNAMTEEEKVNAALLAVKAELLQVMSDSELYWDNFKKTGEIKKSKVYTYVYENFPILKNYLDQEKIIAAIDNMIDELKPIMDKIINGIDSEVNDITITGFVNTEKEE